MWASMTHVQVYALPMYEFVDTFFGRNYGDKRDWSAHSTLIRFLTRGTFIAIATFFGALLPFFGDFVALTGALSVFPLNFGLVHLMYLKVIFQVCSSDPFFLHTITFLHLHLLMKLEFKPVI
jgi:hypothetical protein